MRVFSYSEARQRFAEVLDLARTTEIVIRRRGGEEFVLKPRRSAKSPLDVPGIKTNVTTQDIVEAIREGHKWPRR